MRGRPPKYKTPELLAEAVASYFNRCDDDSRPYTITGLALALDVSRMTLVNYGRKNAEFLYTIKKARLIVESSLEARLSEAGSSRGVIFNLRVNFGWTG